MAVRLGCDSGHISFSLRNSGHGPKHLGLRNTALLCRQSPCADCSSSSRL